MLPVLAPFARVSSLRCFIGILLVSCVTWNASFADQVVRVGPWKLSWPSGWRFDQDSNAMLVAGPNGEKAMISSFALPATLTDEQAKSQIQTLHSFARDRMPQLAEQVGETVVRGLTRIDLDKSHALYSTVTHGRRRTSDHFYMQYFLVGERSGALVTIEGVGNPADRMSEFDQIFAGVRWQGSP